MTKNQENTRERRKSSLREQTERNIKNKNTGSGSFNKAFNFKDVGEINFFKAQKGRNRIDIIPYVVKTKHHPNGIEEGNEAYILDIFVHSKVGPSETTWLCPKKTFGKPCPICEELAELRKNGGDEDEIKALTPKRRAVYNVIDLENTDKGIQIWDVSHFLFEKELLDEAAQAEDEIIVFADLEDGRTIQFRGTEEVLGGNKFLKFKSFSFEERKKPYKESILDDAYSLDEFLVLPSYEELRNAFLGVDSEEDDKEEDEKPVQKKQSHHKEDDDDEDEKPRKAKSVEKKSGKCTYGHKFGKDCDETDDCADCDNWNACADAQPVDESDD